MAVSVSTFVQCILTSVDIFTSTWCLKTVTLKAIVFSLSPQLYVWLLHAKPLPDKVLYQPVVLLVWMVSCVSTLCHIQVLFFMV